MKHLKIYENFNNPNIKFFQTRDIKDFENLKVLVKDFGPEFLETMQLWQDDEEEDNRFWQVWLFKLDNKIIGVCGLYSLVPFSTKELWLGWLGIIPEMRNKNYGKIVMQFLYSKAKEQRAKTIFSYVDSAGKPLNFYKREGFKIIGTVKDYIENCGFDVSMDSFEKEDDIVIRKDL